MQEQNEVVSHSEVVKIRRQKLAQLREQGSPFPNNFKREHLAQVLLDQFAEQDDEALQTSPQVTVAGRVVSRRIMGKASFVHLRDMSGQIQLYVRKDQLLEGIYQQFKGWDIGDIIGARGTLFKTKTGELTINVTEIFLLTKSIRPLPDKFHGLADIELRYRQRYVDLLANATTRQVFLTRAKVISAIRQFLVTRDFLEVETPMLQPIPGGAAARPFITHHNTLNMDMYLRIAPELYLKRLVVGGFERVFEINRNFRNEGLSTQHNPEFTMLEFYQAYADYHDLIELTESLLSYLAEHILGTQEIIYQDIPINFIAPYAKFTMRQAILHFNPEIKAEELEDIEKMRLVAQRYQIPLQDSYGLGKIQTEIFDKTTEHQLQQPTFITEYPTEVSPLAKRSETNPEVTERFELFIAGREIANGFSELNDPDDQAERFKQQARDKAAGDLEAMHYDADYITALEYGMPPTAGEGIGIDRLVMLLTNSASIRDVILFPHLRPTGKSPDNVLD